MLRALLRVRLLDGAAIPAGPAIYCFNHLSWADPFILMTVLPMRRRLYFFGPREEDMAVGGRNRLMAWTGSSIPYKPGKTDLLGVTRRVGAVLTSGGVIAVAGEGRIGAREAHLLPLNDGPAYFALRSRVPLVPVAICGSSWLRFGGRIQVRIGDPILPSAGPDRSAIAALSVELRADLVEMLADAPSPPIPGRFGRWLTERFNDWPEGSRAAALAAAVSDEQAIGR